MSYFWIGQCLKNGCLLPFHWRTKNSRYLYSRTRTHLVVGMRKVNEKIAIFILLLTIVMIVGLFIKIQVDKKTPTDVETPVKELQVSSSAIEFEEGITEPEVKHILENCNLTMYRLDYDVEDIADKYYIKIENNKNIVIGDEFKSAPDKKKRDYYIISLSEQAIENESFLEMLDKNNLQIKKFVWCELHFGNGSMNWFPEKDAIKIKNELEMNETVLNVFLNYIDG